MLLRVAGVCSQIFGAQLFLSYQWATLNKKVQYVWHSQVEIEHYFPLHISIALLCSKRCSAEFR